MDNSKNHDHISYMHQYLDQQLDAQSTKCLQKWQQWVLEAHDQDTIHLLSFLKPIMVGTNHCIPSLAIRTSKSKSLRFLCLPIFKSWISV